MRITYSAASAALIALAVGGSAAAVDPRPAPRRDAPYFVDMEPLITPIVGPAQIEGLLEVKLALETESPATVSALNAKMPELRDASYIAALEFSRLHASGYLPVDAKRLADDVAVAIQRNHPEVARVLIISVSAVPA